jgi:hypothetical protein
VLFADRDRAVEEGHGVGLAQVGMGETGHEERMRNQPREPAALCNVGRGRRVRDRFGIDGASVRDARQSDLDRREHFQLLAVVGLMAKQCSRFAVGFHRLVVAPLAVEAVPDPCDDAGLVGRPLECVARPRVRVDGGPEGAEALAHVA